MIAPQRYFAEREMNGIHRPQHLQQCNNIKKKKKFILTVKCK